MTAGAPLALSLRVISHRCVSPLGYCARGVSDAFVRAGCEGKKIVRHCRGSVRLKFWADSKRDSEGRSLDQHNLCLPSSPNSHCVECATDPTGLNVAR
jgi:hypothetical protein